MSDLFDEEAAGKFLGGEDAPISPRTLQRWRLTGEGPEYVKLGRNVRYERTALEAFKAANRRTSTTGATS